jgi:phosphoserine phosphatase
MDSEGKGTGMLSKAEEDGICTGPDKLREMKNLIDKYAKPDDVVTVYIGDSNTDLPCLLHADIGIIIGDGKSVIETCKRVGIKVESGGSLREVLTTRRTENKELILYHFHDWNSIIESGILE